MSSIDSTLIPHSALAIQEPPPLPPGLTVIERVRKSFGNKLALRDISFPVAPGQICGLLGPNGAGKTTLFRLLMGILKPTQGTIQIDGLDAFEDRVAVKRLIGLLPDEPVFYSYLPAARSWNSARPCTALTSRPQWTESARLSPAFASPTTSTTTPRITPVA